MIFSYKAEIQKLSHFKFLGKSRSLCKIKLIFELNLSWIHLTTLIMSSEHGVKLQMSVRIENPKSRVVAPQFRSRTWQGVSLGNEFSLGGQFFVVNGVQEVDPGRDGPDTFRGSESHVGSFPNKGDWVKRVLRVVGVDDFVFDDSDRRLFVDRSIRVCVVFSRRRRWTRCRISVFSVGHLSLAIALVLKNCSF